MMTNVPLPPQRGDGAALKMAEVAPPAAAQAQPAPVAPSMNAEGPMEGLEGLGGGIMEFLQGLFGNAFGGEAARPGHRWDALEGWVPDGSAPPAPAPAPAAPAAPASAPLPPRRPAGI
jgi:hypothetical protein